MAGNDNHTYGFNRDDHDALIAGIGMTETETPGRRGSGGGGGDTLYAFELTANMSSFAATANIQKLDGVSFDEIESSTVYDPVDIFSSLLNGATGLCIKQGGRYYIIQAHCPT